jgi:hypothetical protein
MRGAPGSHSDITTREMNYTCLDPPSAFSVGRGRVWFNEVGKYPVCIKRLQRRQKTGAIFTERLSEHTVDGPILIKVKICQSVAGSNEHKYVMSFSVSIRPSGEAVALANLIVCT